MFLYLVFIPRPDASRSLLIDDEGHEIDTASMLNTAVKVKLPIHPKRTRRD